MNAIRYSFLILLILVLVGCGQGPTQTGEVAATATAVPTDDSAPTATPIPTGVTVLADGVVQAARPLLPLAFETGGKLLAVNVQPGDVVQAGEVIATLDDAALQEAIANTTLQVAQAENGVAQAQAELDRLLAWQPDELVVSVAEANLVAAETALANAQTSDAAAGNSLTAANVNINQAQRTLADAQKAYDTAFDPGREWELSHPWYADALKAEREGTTRAVEMAQEQLRVAQANYALAAAGLNNDTAVSAQANLLNAQQALEQAQRGPKPEEITAARLRLEQAQISLEQSQLGLQQAQNALSKAQLIAPWTAVVLTVDAAPGALVGGGSPIVTLLDTTQLEFHTTNLSERDLAQIAPGDAVQVTLKTYPNDPLTGTVLRIGLQAAGTVGDAATFPVIIALDTAVLDIRPGMTGRAEIKDLVSGER
ncbi:MAG TPA: efflux RND transporter periplasmic adaptor subunit [Chloroflexota bacterium]|nr:efflux RND transporter periplasmic adaptor subunit [Chloroflexota bacterium]